MPVIDLGEPVTVRRADLDTLIRACLRYLPGMPDDPDPDLQAAFIRLDDARHETAETTAAAPMPDGFWGRVELPGWRNHTGWITEETRFGAQVAVVRDWNGGTVAEVCIGPMCQVVHLPAPLKRPDPLAITSGDEDDDLDDDDDEPLRWRDD